jgi:hypothetical protein
MATKAAGIVRGKQDRRYGGVFLLTVALVFSWASISEAQTYLCPPAPEGVYGLPGPPKFADTPDSFSSQLDDPRWNGAWREDFINSSSTDAGVRILNDGSNLFMSLQATVDPDSTGPHAGSDAIYLGFATYDSVNGKNGLVGVIVQITFMSAPPTSGLTNDPNLVVTSNWWKTTDGGATWPKSVPQGWASPTNVHDWTGPGTANGAAWAFNAKISLADLGTALGLSGALTGPFLMWYEIDVATSATTVPYAWPAGTAIEFDTTTAPCSPASKCALEPLNTWGVVYPSVAANCPTGISIDPMSIGVANGESGGIPGTVVHYGIGNPSNDFIADMVDTGGNAIQTGSVKGEFRIADWGSQIGVNGTWKSVVTTGNPPVAAVGTNGTSGSQVSLPCDNQPPAAGVNSCYQLPLGAPSDQCLLVELSQNGGAADVKFVHDSARRNMDFVNASTFERSATLSIAGLPPLAGSAGTRDIYVYVRTLHMPSVTDGNHQAPIPPPVPPVVKVGERNRAAAVNQGPPRYRMTTYERIASVTPTYEVHVYHDTGRTRVENGHTLHVLEPQGAFGYFVQHAGDLSGWKHALTGEGFVLEEIGPNFYRAKVPDNGSLRVHTTIRSCQRHLFGLINLCGHSLAGCGGCQCTVGNTGVPSGAAVFALATLMILYRRRRGPRGGSR